MKDEGTTIERLYAPYSSHMRFVGDPPKLDWRNPAADKFIAATGAEIYKRNERESGRLGSYSLKRDIIRMAGIECFDGWAAYYGTLFHEMIHWTEHPSRLNRQLGVRFGEKSIAMEEMIAELGAAFLCAEFAISNCNSHADYIKDFFEQLDTDPRALFAAVAMAQAAVDFLFRTSFSRQHARR